MYLKRLEIQGFKSFANRTVLDFLPPNHGQFSITAVVGPNGAGKSNLTDAIRWVMGERSMRALRGEKSEDVIFNGSESKGALSAAEVTMILDNSDNRIDLDYPELVITRRLYRSGDGEYLINNNPARLLEVQLLLARAQFAEHAYSIVSQGMIDRLLTVSPAERKDFFDEAVGIKEFQIKQHQAELKLTKTRENMREADALIQEVEPRLKILARQVKKLEKRQEIEISLRALQEQYYALLYLSNQAELNKLNSALDVIETNYRQAFEELGVVQGELAALAQAAARQEKADEAQDTLSQYINQQKKILEQISKDKTSAQLKIFELEKKIFQDQSEQNYRQVSGLFAAQSVLENKDKFGVVHGLVAELGEAEEKYRLALETAAGSYLSAIVVASEDVARQAIEFLRHNRLGVATFLPLNKIESRWPGKPSEVLTQAGVLGLAAEIIKHEKKFANIFSFVFGQTIVVENLSVAQKIGVGHARMVTLDGDLVEKSGAMKGGFKQVKKGSLGFSSSLSWSKDQLAEYQAQINLEKQKITELDSSYESAKEKLLELESKKEAANSKTKLLQAFALQEQMQKKQNLVNEILAKRNDLKIEAARLETKQETLAQEVRAELNADVELIAQRIVPPQGRDARVSNQIEDLEKLGEIQKLKYQLSLIGGIDEEVVSDYRNTKERFEFLSGQLEDLEKATADLEKMIAELAEVMTVKRATAFKKIRREFDRYFKILFAGGKAGLEEVYGEAEENDGSLPSGASPLAGEDTLSPPGRGGEEEGEAGGRRKNREKILTGIEITANPPGKKIKQLNALSGGERTLTSIALICAILNQNPSPFVVLDEVEAALDEANTVRFVQIMSELSARSQFIIITHNRVTMHAANALYGVVMGVDGISKLLSVKMAEVGQYDKDA